MAIDPLVRLARARAGDVTDHGEKLSQWENQGKEWLSQSKNKKSLPKRAAHNEAVKASRNAFEKSAAAKSTPQGHLIALYAHGEAAAKWAEAEKKGHPGAISAKETHEALKQEHQDSHNPDQLSDQIQKSRETPEDRARKTSDAIAAGEKYRRDIKAREDAKTPEQREREAKEREPDSASRAAKYAREHYHESETAQQSRERERAYERELESGVSRVEDHRKIADPLSRLAMARRRALSPRVQSQQGPSQTGSRGGVFVITRNGHKFYLPRP